MRDCWNFKGHSFKFVIGSRSILQYIEANTVVAIKFKSMVAHFWKKGEGKELKFRNWPVSLILEDVIKNVTNPSQNNLFLF
jgi:hypothetical protein